MDGPCPWCGQIDVALVSSLPRIVLGQVLAFVDALLYLSTLLDAFCPKMMPTIGADELLSTKSPPWDQTP